MSPMEVEVKAVLSLSEERSDRREIWNEAKKKLLVMGARSEDKVEQRDMYLSHPCRDYAASDEAIRIRTQRSLGKDKDGAISIHITYKGPKVSDLSKSREEIDIVLGENVRPEHVMELFSRIGFSSGKEVIKERELFIFDGMDIGLDYVEDLGVFAEVEMISENVEDAERRILEFMDRTDWTVRERRSYLEMLIR